MPEIAEPDVSTVTTADHPLDGINADFDVTDTPADATEAATETPADGEDASDATPATDATPGTPEADKTPVEAKETKPAEPKVEDKPAEPKPADPKAVEAQQKAEAEFLKWDTQFSETLASIDEIKPEEIYDNPQKLLTALSASVKGLAYAREAINAQAAKIKALETGKAEETYWQSFQRQTPEVPINKAQDIWGEELTKARGSYKNEAAAQAVATERFKDRIAIVKGQAKNKPAATPVAEKPKPAAPSGKPKPPVTKGGGNVIPKAGSTQPPKPAATSPEDEFAAMIGQSGVDAILERT